MNIQFELLPHQADFVNSEARYCLNSGGVGSGKTYSVVLKALKIAIEEPGSFGLIGAATFPQLRNTTMREFLKIIPSELIAEYNKSNSHFTLKNGSEIIFKQLDSEVKIKSYNVSFIAIEEMSDIKEDIFMQCRLRIREIPNGRIFGATNPSSFSNHVYRNFIEKPIKNSEVFYSRSIDNIYLPSEYIEDLESLKESNPEYYKRMVDGVWGQLEGLIYSLPFEQRNFDKNLRFQKYIAGLDFGFSHPTAFLVIGIIEDKYYVIDELYQHKMTSSDIITAIQDKLKQYPIQNIYCDSSRPEIIEDLKRANIPAEEANKSVFEGIMHVKSLINQENLYVSSECNFTLREFDSYIWDTKQTVNEVPLKVNDDCMDSLRYALFTDRAKISINYNDRFVGGGIL